MMMIDDVVALVRSVHDGDHMLADGVFLLRLLHLLEALDLVLDLDHTHRHLRRTQIQDFDRVNPRLAWTGHDLKPPFLAVKYFPEIVRLLHGDAGDQWSLRTQKGNCIMLRSAGDGTRKPRVFRLGSREIITEGLQLSFWADISHRCMTASWPAFIAGAAF